MAAIGIFEGKFRLIFYASDYCPAKKSGNSINTQVSGKKLPKMTAIGIFEGKFQILGLGCHQNQIQR
jgi:hypothetical protein